MLDKQKYFKELYEVESKDIPTHSFLARDFGVKKDCKYFIETGTHLGHGVQYALPDKKILVGCYHPSPRNVNTKRLDVKKMVFLFKKVQKLLNKIP